MTTPVLRAAGCIPLLLLLAGCGGGPSGEEVEFRVQVAVQEVGRGTVENRVTATGTLRAPEVVNLTVPTAGTLEVASTRGGRRLTEGDRVRAGQEVAAVTGEDVRLAARTDATRQRYDAALDDARSKRKLYEQGLISETELKNAETTLADAKVEWERSRYTEQQTRLVTPIDGVILRLARDADGSFLADGQKVVQGFVVAQIAKTNPLVADVDLVGADIARVRVGLPARIRHPAFPDQAFPGRVSRLAPSIDPTTRTFRTEVKVKNPQGKLRPGMFVEVTIVAEQRKDVPVVPREAVTERGGSHVVFVLKGQRVSRRDVVLGLGDDRIVEIRKGVEPGERVVVRGLETLADGTRVRVTGA